MSARRWPVAPAAVALALVDEHERPLVEELLATEPAFRGEVERLRAATAALDGLDPEAWAPEAPPPLDRGLRASADQPATQPAPRAARPAARRRRPRRAALVAAALATAAAALVALVVLRAGGDDGAGRTATTLALRPLAGAAGRAQLTVAGAEAELRGRGLRPSGAHDYYEAWLADDRGHMVSMGTFRVPRDGRVDVHMAVAVDVSRYALVDVSLEPDDGDPGHSDRSVLRARL